jgi:hypothetical protein
MNRMLALLVLATCAIGAPTPVEAVALNPRGLGQALVYPYYTVNKGQDTLLSVINATGTGKAVVVRFRESYNGRSTLDFMLYLSPRDRWTAVVSQTGDDGVAHLLTTDTSCTVPQIPAEGIDFQTGQFTDAVLAMSDGGPTTPARTREGSIELIAGADLVPGSPTDTAVAHVQNGEPNGGVPADCTAIRDDAADYAPPANGLAGSVAIVNVGEGTFFGYNADALAGFTDVALTPSLGIQGIGLDRANSADAISGGAFATVIRDDGRPLELEYALGIDAVSAVFMAEAIYNEFLVAPSLGAETDWVVTFPTKQWYVDGMLQPDAPRQPFTASFAAPGVSDVSVHGYFHDQEEGRSDTYPPENGCGFICPGGESFVLSWQTNVIRVLPGATPAAAAGVLGSGIAVALEPFPGKVYQPPGDAGWIALEFAPSAEGGQIHVLSGGGTPSTSVDLYGLPATGFMVYNIINANAAPNRLANYGGAFPHRASIGCQVFGPFNEQLETCD